MRRFFGRTFGVLLILAAITGFVFSISGLVTVIRAKPTLVRNITDSIDLIIVTLDTTAEGLEITQQSLETSVESVRSLQVTIQSTTKAIDSTLPLMDSVAIMLKEDLPRTISAVQTSLSTAQQSAKIIDTVLRALTFLNRNAYNPAVPLDRALSQISASMNDLPETFANMEANLQQTSSQIETIKAELELISVNIDDIEASLERYADVVEAYLVSVAEIESKLFVFKSSISSIVDRAIIGAIIFLIWMAIAQIGLLTQGWELLKGKTATTTEETLEEETGE